MTRSLEDDRVYQAADGSGLVLPGRGLLFVRNVGHLMTTPAVMPPADGSEAPEGIDAIVTSLIALHDLNGLGRFRNSRAGWSISSSRGCTGRTRPPSPTACSTRSRTCSASIATRKVGVMDEERTSANLAACIHAVKDRIVFINTGFLDRTGDEIHTSMRAGAMVPRAR